MAIMAQSRLSRSWNDLIPAATVTKTGPTAAAYLQFGTTDLYFPTFTDNHGSDETYQTGFQFTHAWAIGSTAHPHLHIIPTANGSAGNEDVVLQLNYQWINVGDAFNTTTSSGITNTFRVGSADANKNLIWEFTSISGVTKTLSSSLICTITRLSKTSVVDNYTGNICLTMADIHVENDRSGSINETTD